MPATLTAHNESGLPLPAGVVRVAGRQRTPSPTTGAPSGGFFISLDKTRRRRARTLIRVTRIKASHIVGRMALAIIHEADLHRVVTSPALHRAGFSAGEIRKHAQEAMSIARSFAPDVLNAWDDLGA